MPVTPELLDRLAALAMLNPGQEERRALAAELEEITAYLAQLGPWEGEEAPPPGPGCPLRPDQPAPSLPREELLACASARDGEYFLTPRAVE